MDVLRAYTSGGAWAAHREHVTGRLVPGMAGDLVLLGGDIERVAPEDVGAMGIALTVCGGRITHESGAGGAL
jgi:predicted amidohydrolase YtcJ